MEFTADDQQFQQEQIARAEEIRSILERTFAVAQAQGAVRVDEIGDWRYDGRTHSLVYDSQNQAFWIESADGQLNVHWDGQKYNSDLSDVITDEQFLECRKLKHWLDEQEVSQDIDLANIQTISTFEASQAAMASLSTAERLFEFYAGQGTSAYRLSADSTEQCYRLVVDDFTYIVSRDDVTGEYDIQREGAAIGFTAQDEQVWNEINYWLGVQELGETAVEDLSAEPYWDQQQRRADQVLPIAQRVFAYQSTNGFTQYEPNCESYVAQHIGQEYIIGYRANDELWIANLNGEVLITSTDRAADYDSATNSWFLEGLGKASYLSAHDVAEFQSLDHWLNAKEWITGQNLDQWSFQDLAAAYQMHQMTLQKSPSDERRSDLAQTIQQEFEPSQEEPSSSRNQIRRNDAQIEL